MAKHYSAIPLLCFLTAFGSNDLQAQRTIWPLMRDHGRQVAATHPHTSSGRFRSDPIWSDDFSDPAHWTFGTLDSTGHNWVVGTAVPGGTYPMPAISSTSAANGYALFDSGLPCGPDNGYMATVAPIDLSAEAHVQLQFEQFNRKFQGHTYVDVSSDGSTWTPFEVNVQLNVGQYTANAEVFHLDISSMAALQDSVWFRFRYVGNCDYAWMVDDVALVQQPAHELQLVTAATTSWNYDTNASFDSVYYSAMPNIEVRPRALNMTCFNAGYLPATNVIAHITTSDGYDQSQLLDTIAPGDTAVWNAPLWTPQASSWFDFQEDDRYIYYDVLAEDTDMFTFDNADTLLVSIGGHRYSRDGGSMDGSIEEGGNAYKVGNWFHVANDFGICELQVAIASGSATGVEINAQILDDSLQPLIETGYHTVEPWDLSPMGGLVVVDLYFGSPAFIEGGRDYFVLVQHFEWGDVRFGTSGYSAPQSSLLYRSTEDAWSSISTTPIVRVIYDDPKVCSWAIGEEDGLEGISLEQCLPNPANDHTQIQFTLKNPMPASLTLHDMNGKLLRTLVDGPTGTGQHQVEINTRNLDAGVYFYTLRTPTGMATMRMVVMH